MNTNDADDAPRPPFTVIVADDQPIIRDGFAAVLDADPMLDVIGRARDGAELVEMVRQRQPDVAVVDIRMPVMDGITATSHISDQVNVLILTTFDLDDYVYAALNAGARGFLLKDVPATRLTEAVKSVAEGSLILGPQITDRLLIELSSQGGVQRGQASDHGLSAREAEVLTLLARGLSNTEIAQHMHISHETVKSHVSAILRTLNVRDRVQAVVYAFRNGLAG